MGALGMMGLAKSTKLLFEAARRGDAMAVRMFIRQRRGPFPHPLDRALGWLFGPRLHALTLTQEGLQSPLMQAAAFNHVDCVQALLPHAPAAHLGRALNGASLLAARGQEASFWLLLEAFKTRRQLLDAPLDEALCRLAATDRVDLLRALLDLPFAPDEAWRAQRLCAAALVAAESGALDCLRLLHARHPAVLLAQHRDGYGLLSAAARTGQLECIQFVLQLSEPSLLSSREFCLDPQAHPNTAVLMAATHGQTACVELLLKHCPPEAVEAQREQALRLALRYEWHSCALSLGQSLELKRLEHLMQQWALDSWVHQLAPLWAQKQRESLQQACTGNQPRHSEAMGLESSLHAPISRVSLDTGVSADSPDLSHPFIARPPVDLDAPLSINAPKAGNGSLYRRESGADVRSEGARRL